MSVLPDRLGRANRSAFFLTSGRRGAEPTRWSPPSSGRRGWQTLAARSRVLVNVAGRVCPRCPLKTLRISWRSGPVPALAALQGAREIAACATCSGLSSASARGAKFCSDYCRVKSAGAAFRQRKRMGLGPRGGGAETWTSQATGSPTALPSSTRARCSGRSAPTRPSPTGSPMNSPASAGLRDRAGLIIDPRQSPRLSFAG